MTPALPHESTFARDTRAIRVSAHAFRSSLHERWNSERGPNAGYLAALLLDALLRAPEVGPYCVRSFHVRFLRVPRLGAVDIPTRLEHQSKAACAVAGALRQGERVCALGSVATLRPSAAARGFVPPDCPVPGRAFDYPRLRLPRMPPMSANYEYRSLYATPSAPCSSPYVGGFLRLGEPQPLDARTLTAFCDAWFPAAYARQARPIAGTCLDLTVHFRDLAALTRLAPDAFVFCRFQSRAAQEGVVDEDGELWSEHGELLAQSRQMRLTPS